LVTIGCGADADPCPHGTVELCEKHGRALATEVSRLLEEANWRMLPPTPAAAATVLKVSHGKNPGSETFQVAVWTFGDELAMIFFSDEVVVDYARRLKQEFDGGRLWISAYTNDVSRYIVSKRLLSEGGYEVRSSLSSRVTDGHHEQLTPAMEDRIMEAVESLLPAGYLRK